MGGESVFKRFRLYLIVSYTPAVISKIWSKLIFAILFVILRLRIQIIYVGACYSRGARFMRSYGSWGERGHWTGGGHE